MGGSRIGAWLGLLCTLGAGQGCFSHALQAEAAQESETGPGGSSGVDALTTLAPEDTAADADTAARDPEGDDTGSPSGGESSATEGPDARGDSDASSGFGTEGGSVGGPCCEPHRTPGCDDVPRADACVCEVDDYCCNVRWDEVCVDLFVDLGCGMCGTNVVPDPQGDCCQATPSTAGCLDQDVEACVCAADPFCCQYGWDDACANTAVQTGCGCGESTDSASTGGGATSDCCEPTGVPGCTDPAIEACVCAVDPFCCDIAWDSACVYQVASAACGECSYPPGTGECCEPHGTEGCEDQAIQDCVCAFDPFCCTIEWDDVCAGGVEANGCGACLTVSSGSSEGGSEPSTTGT